MNNKRIHIVFFCFLILFGILITRLAHLSLIGRQDKPIIREEQVNNLLRGSIYSVNKDTLGVTLPFYSLYINPTLIDKTKEVGYHNLFVQLGMTEQQISDVLTSSKKFRWLTRMIPKETFLALQKHTPLSLPGVASTQEYKRVYPHHFLASSVLGFTNIDGKGISGIEYSMNEYLSPSIFSKVQEQLLGYDVVLTLDSRLQAMIEEILKNTAQELQPKSISALIMEADTGKILSMASYPSFDPNFYNTYNDPSIFSNTTVSSVDEPGSTFKPLVMAHLFDKQLINTQSSFTSKGREKINGFAIKESTGRNLGTLTPRDILVYSSNIGMVKASQDLTKEDIYNLLTNLHFGEKSGLSLPGEEKGLIRSATNMTNRSKLAIPIGQEIGVTPLQLVSAFTALANKGVQSIPRIIERLEYEGKEVSFSLQDKLLNKTPVYSKKNAELILSYMRDVVLKGSARKANIPGEWIAAKTGTAQIFNNETKTYSELNTSVIAIYKNKKNGKFYVVYGVIRAPHVDEKIAWGGTLAAPMVKEFIASLIQVLKNNR